MSNLTFSDIVLLFMVLLGNYLAFFSEDLHMYGIFIVIQAYHILAIEKLKQEISKHNVNIRYWVSEKYKRKD